MKRWLPFFALLLAGCELFSIPILPPAPTETAPCVWQWATVPLPDLSDELNESMVQAGITGVTVRASAYGENCLNPDASLRYFATISTDYEITASADQLAGALSVLASEAQAGHAGNKPGYVTLLVDSERLRVRFEQVTDALGRGLDGEALLAALRGA